MAQVHRCLLLGRRQDHLRPVPRRRKGKWLLALQLEGRRTGQPDWQFRCRPFLRTTLPTDRQGTCPRRLHWKRQLSAAGRDGRGAPALRRDIFYARGAGIRAGNRRGRHVLHVFDRRRRPRLDGSVCRRVRRGGGRNRRQRHCERKGSVHDSGQRRVRSRRSGDAQADGWRCSAEGRRSR